MIQCSKCGNDTRTSELVTTQGSVMLAGTLGTDPQPVIAQVCGACGFIELYAPQPIATAAMAVEASEPVISEPELVPTAA